MRTIHLQFSDISLKILIPVLKKKKKKEEEVVSIVHPDAYTCSAVLDWLLPIRPQWRHMGT